jgi:hypothetical protein
MVDEVKSKQSAAFFGSLHKTCPLLQKKAGWQHSSGFRG